MSDVEMITELNHRRAREKELGQRWHDIEALHRKQGALLKLTNTVCFSVGCMLIGGAAFAMGLGLFRAAVMCGGLAGCCFFGTALTGY